MKGRILVQIIICVKKWNNEVNFYQDWNKTPKTVLFFELDLIFSLIALVEFA